MSVIDPQVMEYYRKRYKTAHADEMLRYAQRSAIEYAERYAAGMLPSIKHGIAQLHLRHSTLGDIGEKKQIRLAIDTLLAIGGAIKNASA